MIRTLLATTALATLVASGAYAQDTTAPAASPAPATEQAAPAAPVERADGSLVTNIIGETVYNGTGDDAENIGEVNDVVFDKDGQVKSIIIGVGGFLGVGEKNVAFDYGKLQWAEQNGDRWLVAQTSKDELKAQPAFDMTPYEPAQANQASTDTAVAPAGTAPADGSANNSTASNTAPAGTAPSTESTMAPADTAQNNANANAPAATVQPAEGSLASNIVGESVYNGTGDDAQDIGDVNDILIAKDGKAQSLIIGVGGFLGIGEKNVAYDFSKAKWAERDGDSWIVAETTKEQLEQLPDFDRKAYDPAPAAATASNDATQPAATATAPATTTPAVDTSKTAAAEPDATAPAATDNKTAEAPAATDNKTAEAPAATDNNKTAEATPPATAPEASTDTAQNTPPVATDQTKTGAIDKSTLTEMPMSGDIRSEDLVGTTVYGANDETVGEVGDVALTTDGKVDAIIIDVGGFLGIGEKEVAVGMDNLKFMTDKDNNKYLYTNFTKDQLEAQTAYDKGTYAQKRDEQRMMVQ
jgi:sporulation protein YlmC with PRC-barrel domain